MGLPMRPAAADAGHPGDATAEPQRPVQVLLVEDDDAEAALVTAALRSARSVRFDVQRCKVLAAARQRLADAGPAIEVLLVDLSLPDSAGLATVHACRSAAPRLPLIVLTGHDDVDFALRTLDAGAQDYLVKGGFDADGLERSIRHAIGRSRLEQRLAESEERWRFALEGAGDGLWDRDFVSGQVYYSRRWKQMLGHGDDEIGADIEEWSSRVHPDDLGPALAEFDAYLEANRRGLQRVYVGERRMRHKDGHWLWVEARGMVVARNAAGEPVRMIGTHTDISERKAVEAALRAGEARYQRLVQNVGDAIVVDDLEGRIVFANQRFYDLLGLQPRSEMALRDHVLPAYRAALAAQREAVLRTGSAALSFDYEAVRQDGTRLWLEARFTAVIEQGRAAGTQAAIRDITEKRHAEAALRAQQLAEQASRAKSEFVSRISHELRTPLNAILGFSEILQLDETHPLADDQQRRVERIRAAGNHLLMLINDLLDISRIEAGTMSLRIEELDAAAVLDDAWRDLLVLAQSRGVTLLAPSRKREPTLPRVRADATRLRQVLHNLVSNAIKYNRRGGRVELQLLSSGSMLQLVVSDDGVGMTAEQQQRLFEPFNRLGREGGSEEGSGIGLVIVKYLVELMGGQVQVTSRAGQGSQFVVELPAVQQTRPAANATVPRTAPRLRSELCGSVLYIDDNEPNRMLMEAFFSLRPGLRLTLAHDGASGIACATRQRPDLVLIDIRLPDISGMQVLQAVRALEPSRHLPCIAVSANAMPDDIATAEAAGFDAYLTKPLSAAVLFEAIDRHFG